MYLLVTAWIVVFGALAARLADRRRRRAQTWLVFGAVLGPVALLLLELAPPGRCYTCAAPTRGWLTDCLWCGEDVRGPAADARPGPEPSTEAGVHAHGPLTVIEGSASRRVDAEPADGTPQRRHGDRPAAGRGRRSTDAVAGSDSRRAAPFAESDAARPAAVSGAGAGGTARPVRTLASRQRGGASSLAESSPDPEPAPPPMPALPETRNVVLASAICLTASRVLQSGSQYTLALVGHDLHILGPVSLDPSAVAIAHPLPGMDATAVQGRLIVTGPLNQRNRLVLAFASVVGGSAEAVADTIVRAAVGAEAADR